jgi:hypothetical protein
MKQTFFNYFKTEKPKLKNIFQLYQALFILMSVSKDCTLIFRKEQFLF